MCECEREREIEKEKEIKRKRERERGEGHEVSARIKANKDMEVKDGGGSLTLGGYGHI